MPSKKIRFYKLEVFLLLVILIFNLTGCSTLKGIGNGAVEGFKEDWQVLKKWDESFKENWW